MEQNSEQLVARFLEGVDEVLVIEELSPFIEREITYVCGKYNIKCKVLGKLTKDVQCAGENTAKSVREQLTKFGVAKDIDDGIGKGKRKKGKRKHSEINI